MTHQMRIILMAAAAAVLTGCSTGNTPREVKVYSAETFFDTTSMFGASFSSDESAVLVSSDASGVFNAYRQPIGGGEPQKLTTSTTDTVFAVSYFPKDDRILYSADSGGNEKSHVFVRELDGTVRDLTPGDLKASFAGWSQDHKHFWITTNERDPAQFDIYEYKTDGYTREMVFKNTEAWAVSDISRDGRFVALGKTRNNADSDIYIQELSSLAATPVHITPHEGNAQHRPMTFTPDGSELYYVTDGKGEFNQAWAYNIKTRKHRPVIKAKWDVTNVTFSEKGRYRVSSINEDAVSKITVHDTKTGRNVRIPDLPAGQVSGVNISRSESKMAFYLNGSTSPSNLYVMDLKSGKLNRLSNTLSTKINRDDLVEARVVRYDSFDGLKIPSILYRPHPASSDNKVPALVWVHGGPGGQSRVSYSPMIQHLANNGYAVLAVNNRGSSGYGKTFFHMDDQKHGDVDLQDCVWARKYLESLDWVDGQQIGIMGGSYGGYMVAAALTFEPEVFDVGINIFGVTNWLRTLESIPPWWSSFREALYAEMGDPATDETRLRRISPLFHADNIVRPLLVVQGANDPRVLQVESDELVEAARKNGTPVEYVLFPDEGHGFRKKVNRIKASQSYVDFLNAHLKRS